MLVQNFRQFGGRHYETAAMRNILAHVGMVSPASGQPLTEAMCLGIAGGIAAGYSFCPSRPEGDEGSGVTVIGRYKAYVTGADYYTGLFDKLKVRTTIKETTSEKSAYRNLVDAISSQRPAIVWCAPFGLTYASHPRTCSMYSFIVYGVDEARQMALVSDRAHTGWEMDLNELAASRKDVCSHKNRLMTIDAPIKLTQDTLKSAVMNGVQACVRDLMVPHIKTFNLPGLLEWARVLPSVRNRKGWLVVYPDGNLYPALRDTFDSIETAGTGGKLFRDMYAEFLEEAAPIAGRDKFKRCADLYRTLGNRWQNFAHQALPDAHPAFSRTKELLLERKSLVESVGTPARPRMQEIHDELVSLEQQMHDHFPLGHDDSLELLNQMAAEIESLYELEMDAAEALESATRG